ncbi:acetate kinase [Jonesiaceae bacterium BS-20]|uniref:Acetate kinase n=1 Tax=Jonesiaceae bacterium BS-20 TaxID=3120821 RepID=A0AAU7DRZ8_9MICO
MSAVTQTVLVINAGSSSIKYQLVNPATKESIASGLVEQIGESAGHITHEYGDTETELDVVVPDHGFGLRKVLELFASHGPDLATANVVAVGHRVVQGGERFSGPTLITDEVLDAIKELIPLAPLHNPGHVRGIEVARELFPDLPHVAIFDTAFFQTLPQAAYTYAIDTAVSEKFQIRRYGFHGTSHDFVSAKAAATLGKDIKDIKQIVLHLGNGASVSAVDGGRAVETSMGLTPLEGLVMGTRSGDIDPAIIMHLHRVGGMSIDEIDTLLNKQSGLKGMSGVNDFRQLLGLVDSGDEKAKLAFDVYVHRLLKYVGSYIAVLGGKVDVISFTAGIGENSSPLRAALMDKLAGFGVTYDAAKNQERSPQARIISNPDSAIPIMVVPTNEELAIAQQTIALIAD